MARPSWSQVAALVRAHRVDDAIKAARRLLAGGQPKSKEAAAVLRELAPYIHARTAPGTENRKGRPRFRQCGASHPKRPNEICVLSVKQRHEQHVSANGWKWSA